MTTNQYVSARARKVLRAMAPQMREELGRATHKPTVIVVLMSQGAVFLCRSVTSSDIWPCPKGGMERGESILKAARREGEEELGLKKSDFRVVQVSKGTIRIWIRDPRRRKAGYSQGKFFMVLTAQLRTARKRIRVNQKELAEGRWIDSIAEFERYTTHMMPLRRLRLWFILKMAKVPWAVSEDLRNALEAA